MRFSFANCARFCIHYEGCRRLGWGPRGGLSGDRRGTVLGFFAIAMGMAFSRTRGAEDMLQGPGMRKKGPGEPGPFCLTLRLRAYQW